MESFENLIDNIWKGFIFIIVLRRVKVVDVKCSKKG